MLFPISSRVKGLLISSFMEWRGAYFLGLIYARIHVAMRGGGIKNVWTLLGVNIFGTTETVFVIHIQGPSQTHLTKME